LFAFFSDRFASQTFLRAAANAANRQEALLNGEAVLQGKAFLRKARRWARVAEGRGMSREGVGRRALTTATDR
jgi:hypothetical protein